MSPTKPCFHRVALILAGGKASRFQGLDKALLMVGGRPLIRYAIDRLTPQVETIALNSNAPADHYARFGVPVIADQFADQPGPLAGIHAGLHAFPNRCVLTVAVDLPLLPHNLVARLSETVEPDHPAYARVHGHHALAILWPPGMASVVAHALSSGQLSVKALLESHGRAVDFPPDDKADLSLNLNSPDALREFEAMFATRRHDDTQNDAKNLY